jgi:hypothetical protein
MCVNGVVKALLDGVKSTLAGKDGIVTIEHV